MNFQGRWYTANETCVAVHGGDNANEFWGHEIRLVEPFKDNRKFYWDEKGECKGYCSLDEELLDDASMFDLVSRVKPMSYAHSIEVVDCEVCREERKEKTGGK